MVTVLRVTLDADLWPEIRCSIHTVSNRVWTAVERTSVYDTAIANLEMPLLNVFRQAIRDMVAQHKQQEAGHGQEQNAQGPFRVQTRETEERQRPQGEVAQASSRDRVRRVASIKAKKKVRR